MNKPDAPLNPQSGDPQKTTGFSSHPLRFDADNRPYSLQYGDHFFSSSGGRAECLHVFIKGNQLPHRWQGVDQFTIGELGFGSGLNFLETWHQWIRCRRSGQLLDFVSFELLPMGQKDMRRVLTTFGALEGLAQKLMAALHSIGDSGPLLLDEQTRLTLIHGDCRNTLPDWQGCADAWYLDGFSPAKNPEMWQQDVMDQLYRHTSPGGTFATYTSAGWVRENLQNSGFIVQRMAGFGQKKHMSAGLRSVLTD